MRAALAEIELSRLANALADDGFEALLGKGWGVARSYPQPGLRPYGDFDMYVRPADAGRLAALAAHHRFDHGFSIDVHPNLSYLDDRNADGVFARSLLVPVGNAVVRLPGPEDQLRLVCLHAFAEGVIRPPWLCDIARLIHDLPAEFDRDWFAQGSARRTAWVGAAIGLARDVLGVTIPVRLTGAARSTTPRWMSESVVRVWGKAPLAKGSRRPATLRARNGVPLHHLLAQRWPNPIEATVGVGGDVNQIPRFPYQLADVIRRTSQHIAAARTPRRRRR
jgi:hypothetical protein